MLKTLKTWLSLKTDRRGVTMLEYAIMGALIATALVAAVPTITNAMKGGFNSIGNSLNSAG
jgi:Flp pilus assembly pilin Flp